MKRASAAGAVVLSAGLAIACGGGDERRAGADEPGVETRPVPINETGCLTASGDTLVLTNLVRAEGQPTTETFQLAGDLDGLRRHVGQQVRVSGEAEAPEVAVVRESSPPPAAPEGTSGTQPTVTAQTSTRLEVRELKVASFEPTGEPCAAEAKGR